MSSYLIKYKGTYRVKAPIDESTNDFARDEKGNFETEDLYIPCSHGSQIYHYGRGILVAYVPSIGRGHNILRALGEELCNIKDKVPYEELYDALFKEGTIKSVLETDEEIEFKFHNKNMEIISKYLKPKTYGANISPFSSRNLPKSDYLIPLEDEEKYKEIIAHVDKKDKLLIYRITKDFIADILSKKKEHRTKDIKADMRLKMMKPKEYIHSLGLWNEYLDYLKKEVSI